MAKNFEPVPLGSAMVTAPSRHGTTKKIGATLFRSELTIKTHVEHILAKTGAKNRAQVCALWAMVAVGNLMESSQNTPNGNRPQNTPNGVCVIASQGASIGLLDQFVGADSATSFKIFYILGVPKCVK